MDPALASTNWCRFSDDDFRAQLRERFATQADRNKPKPSRRIISQIKAVRTVIAR